MSPKFILVRQHHDAPYISDVAGEVRHAFDISGFDFDSLKGKKVGLAVGSRGISNIPLIVRTMVDYVREKGGDPIIFPAMGSHGNGEASGQREVLESLGITEEAMGCEIRTCGDTIMLGVTDKGLKVYANKVTGDFDKIILVNRIKQHTDFEDITESGIYKLMAIGIGNQFGAEHIHERALTVGYGAAIRDAGDYMLKKLPIVLALAVTENWKHQTDHIEAILPENLLKAESRILAAVKERTVRLPFDKFDTLIVKEAGKNISGTCVDTKVVGRIMIAGQKEPERPKIRTIAVLDFTDESHGNSMGLGVVDMITRRVFNKINIDATSLTGRTSDCLLQAKIPCIAPDDADAIESSYRASGAGDPENIRAALIQNTNALEYIAVTENLYEEIKDRADIEKLSEPFELQFDDEGNLLYEFPGHEA